MLYPLSYEGGGPRRAALQPSGPDTDISIQGGGPYYALDMSAAATTSPPAAIYIPDPAATRFYVGALAMLSVLQYFVAETAVIGAWAGTAPYSRRTGYISDLGAVLCGVYDGRDVCSPAHVLMNASFVVQGLAMMVGAALLSAAVLCTAARPGGRHAPAAGQRLPRAAAAAARLLAFVAGAGTVLVGLVPEDAGSPWHYVGALLYFIAGALALLVLGGLWLRQTPLGMLILACGAVSLAALAAGGATGMDVPEPGTLERFMGYPITIGFSAVGLALAQRIRQERLALRRG